MIHTDKLNKKSTCKKIIKGQSHHNMTQPVHIKWVRENMMNRDKYDTMSMENQG